MDPKITRKRITTTGNNSMVYQMEFFFFENIILWKSFLVLYMTRQI